MELNPDNAVTRVTQPCVTDAAVDDEIAVLTTASGYQQLQVPTADSTPDDQQLYKCLHLTNTSDTGTLSTDMTDTNTPSTGTLQHTSRIADADSSSNASKSIKKQYLTFSYVM